MQLGEQAGEFRKRGFNVAAISYDRPELLRHFAQRVGIRYPLLGDPDSKVIRAFGILNEHIPPDNDFFGVPYPGTYVLDEHGIVREKYFEEDYRERYTPASVLTRYFKGEGPTGGSVETKHLELTYSASQQEVRAGNRLLLVLEVELKPSMHVYAPEVSGTYIPIEWKIEESTGWRAHPVSYPPSRKVYLPAIKETLPVYEGNIRLERDLTIGVGKGLEAVVGSGGELRVKGSFRYQACDERMCYRPETIPLEWVFRLGPLDRRRGPEQLRRKN